MRGAEQIPWLYDAAMAVLERLGLGPWRLWLAEGASGRTLDLGCGTGRNLPLLPAGARAVGVDPCAQSLARARRRAPGGAPRPGPRRGAPLQGRGVRHRRERTRPLLGDRPPAAAAAEMLRVLAPGGSVRALEHVRSPLPWKARLQDLSQPAWSALSGGCHPNRDTERTLEEAGLVIDPATRRARDTMRRFEARPRGR